MVVRNDVASARRLPVSYSVLRVYHWQNHSIIQTPSYHYQRTFVRELVIGNLETLVCLKSDRSL
jgi:hypothetical protein